MNEQLIRGLMITVLYPAMIVGIAWLFVFLLERAEQDKTHSSKTFAHRIRK